MFKSVALLAVIAFAAVSAGVIETHTVVEPAVAKIGAVVHSVPSAVSHQSFTRIHNRAEVSHVVAPVVRTVQVAPIVKAVPVAPIVKTVHVAPVVHTYAAPVISHVQYATPVVRAYAAAPVVHAAPIVHSAPLLKTVVSPVTYAVHH